MEAFDLHTLIELLLFLLWLLLLWLLLSRRKRSDSDGGGTVPGTKRVAIGLNETVGRWQLLNPDGTDLAPPIVVKRGETATWENTTGHQLDIQFPTDQIFDLQGMPDSGGRSVDSWIITLGPGATLQLIVSEKAPLGTFAYALWVRGEGSVTGYAEGSTPPRIIVEKA